MKNEKFDIVFLCHEKDLGVIKKSMEYAEKNIMGYRQMFIVSKENYFKDNPNLIFIDEARYPFDKKMIAEHAPAGRAAWYYQQFLKLYFLFVAKKETLENVLIIDADTMFIKKTKFFEGKTPLYNVDIGHHQPYYEILERLYGFGKQSVEYSGTTHHMLFQKKYMKEILTIRGKNKVNDFWEIVMNNINTKTESGFSEQDLYFNYMLKYHPKKIKIRKMNFMNFPYYNKFWISIFSFLRYNYLSSHEYLRKERFSAAKRLVIEFLTATRAKRIIKEALIKLKIIKQR
jgi:hypothetical protein